MLTKTFAFLAYKVENKVLWLQMKYPDKDENG